MGYTWLYLPTTTNYDISANDWHAYNDIRTGILLWLFVGASALRRLSSTVERTYEQALCNNGVIYYIIIIYYDKKKN